VRSELPDQDRIHLDGTMLLGRRVFHCHVHPGDTIAAGDCRIELVEVDDIEVEQSAEAREDGLLGVSDPILESFALLDKVARHEMHVLITGETGTGKELFARALHRRSRRGGGPFVVLDGGAMAPTLAESALFGHRRGAFTGADSDRPGVFEQADGGVLFIDEIGELPLEVQVKLLRALDRQEIVPVGDVTPRKIDVRILAATHRDLRSMVVKATFREDLYFRLAELTLELPSLRERGPNDITYLAKSFLNEIAERDSVSLTLAADASKALNQHDWRGNVRELRGVIKRGAALCEGGVIVEGDLWLENSTSQVTHLDELLRCKSLDAVHRAVDTILLRRALTETQGNISHAARRLEIDRGTLSKRLKDLGISGIGRDEDD